MIKPIRTAVLAYCLVMASCATTKTGPPGAPKPGEKDFDFYLEQGTQSLRDEAYRKAVEQIEKAISINPRKEKAHNLLGIARLNLKEYNAAEEAFRKAVFLNPAYAEAYTNLGGVYFLKERLDEAEQMFKKALTLSPNSISANYSLGELLLLRGRNAEGAVYIARGVELDPSYLETHKTLAASPASSSSEVSELQYTFAKIYAAKGDIKRAIEFLQKAGQAGFHDWSRIHQDKEFAAVLDDPRIKDFLSKR